MPGLTEMKEFISLPALKKAVREPMAKLASAKRDERGNVITMFALLAVPMTALIAGAMEYSTAATARAAVQVAVDAAVLSAGTITIPNANREAYAKTKFEAMLPANIKPHVTAETFKLSIDTAKISGRADLEMPMKFGGFFGQDKLKIMASSEAKVAKPVVRHLDLVMCIDATGSMQNTINAVKNAALTFQTNLNTELQNRGVDNFESMRVRVIYYRDYGGNSLGGYWSGYWPNRTWVDDPTRYGDRPPVVESSFFDMATEVSSFQTFVNSQSATGGGDIPEAGLECVNNGMSSSWKNKGDVITTGVNAGKAIEAVFPVIVVWTDAPAHAPSHARSLLNPNYPSASVMPRNYADLLTKWNNTTVIDQTNKMIIFFGNPDNYLPSYPSDDGWSKVKTWPGYYLGGTLTEGNTNMVKKIADAIALKQKAPVLSQ